MPQFDVSRILHETFVRQVDYLPTVDSTNSHALEWAKSLYHNSPLPLGEGQGVRANPNENSPLPLEQAQGMKLNFPLLVLADRQTAGRGRGTHRWWTDVGSLAFSLLIDNTWMPASSSQLPLIGLAAGVAVIRPVQQRLPGHRVALLWPNDISVADRKLGGILVEISGRRHAVIGIGVNVNNSLLDAPAELQPIAASLLDLTAEKTDLTDLLIEILSGLQSELETLSGNESLTDRFPYYLPQNGSVNIRCKEGIISGICRGIEAEGAIILETADGTKSVRDWTV
jgi:BirA family transcriptional regulator, biotin operon repressor / biotin---[acetyl-CoA-carboxylase] ligase